MPLLYVLWTVALLTIIATAIASSGTVSYHLTHNAAEQIRHEALAEAALNRAVLALLDKRPEQRWRVDAVPQNFTFEGTVISVAIQDELGRIDLNQADVSLLAGLFRGAGQAGEATDMIVDRIIDWRDPDDLRRLHGAEAAEYTTAGFSGRPRNAPFQSVEELKLVLGVARDVYRRVEPFLTVYSNRSMIDPRFAPREVLLALSGGDGARGTFPTVGQDAQGAGIIEPLLPLDGRAFKIQIDFVVGEARISREAVVRLTGDAAKPYWLLNWRSSGQSER